MRILRIAREGMRSLADHKLRAFLMMVGTMIGIAALTIIMAIGKGTHKKAMKRVRNFGPRAMMLIAGGGPDLPPPSMTDTTLKLEDAEAIRQEIDDVAMVCPMAWKFRMNLKYEAAQQQAVVWGVESVWHEAWGWHTVEGEGLAPEEVATMARVCVIGQTVKRELFGDRNPLGERIYINKVSLAVKGVLEKRGTSPMGSDFDNRVIIPITTAMRRVMNVDHLGAIRIMVREAALIPKVARDVRALIHDRHHITPPEEDDFRIVTPMVVAKLATKTSGTLSLLLSVLAALSLIVGGVVLMNILLISVSERTGEIGLRRAVGATRRDIFAQFFAESLAVTFLGMMLGSLLGWGAASILPKVSKIPVILSWQPFALAVVFAFLVGTCFGVQPARRAARLHPIDALR